jgi:type 2A phosphatase activator TIP41
MSNNSILSYNHKRVMPSCAFSLVRFFLRVDGILFRIYDTRIFLDFSKNYFIREWSHKEADYASVIEVNPTSWSADLFQQLGEGSISKVRDPQAVSELLPLKAKRREKIVLC